MWWCWRRNKPDKEILLAKYEVTAPLAYSRPTGIPTHKRGVRGEEVVHHEVGEIVELDEETARIFGGKLVPFVEPERIQRKKPNHRPAKLTRLRGEDVPYEPTRAEPDTESTEPTESAADVGE